MRSAILERWRHRRSEAGDTLVEVLMAIIVLGIAGLALMAAFSTTISGSAQHRSLAANDLVLRAAAESAFSLIEQQTSPAYSTCPVGYSDLISQYNADAANQGEPNFGAPSQSNAKPGQVWYQAAISNVQWWDSSTSSWTSTSSPPTDCTASIPQLITMTVKNGVNGTTESTSFTVNDLNATVGSVASVSVVAVSPREIPVGATQTITISGSGFTNLSTVSLSDPNFVVSTFQSTATSTSIQASVTAPTTVAPGNYDVTVSTGAVSGTGTGLLTVSPVAAVASIQPQYLAQNALGGPNDSYTIYGTNFETGMSVSIPSTATGLSSGVTVTNVVVTSPTTATFTLTSTASAPVGSDPIVVVLPSGASATTAPVLQVNPPPSISSVVTASTLYFPCNPGFGGTADCIINGSGFESGATVSILTNAGTVIGTVNTPSPGASPNDPSGVSQSITFNVSGSTATSTQGLSATVEVVNPDGSSVQYANGFKNG